MDEQIIDLIYKWHRFEQANGLDIIDFDLINQGSKYPGKFTNRKEVLKELKQVINEYKSLESRDIFVQTKLTAFHYFLRELEGEKIPYYDYVENTLGIKPEFIPDGDIKKQQGICKELLDKLGYSFSQEGIHKFVHETRIPEKELKTKFSLYEKEYLPKVLDWLGLDIELKYSKKIVNKDVYWNCYISTDLNGNLTLEFNINSRHPWPAGSLEVLVLHELCSHSIQTASWKKQIETGKLSKAKGLTSVFTPESFAQEGIGQALHLFYPKLSYSDSALLVTHIWRLFHYSTNNAYIMVNEGSELEEGYKYIENLIPGYKSKDSIMKNLYDAIHKPLYRAYMYVYGISEYYFIKIAASLNPQEKKEFVLDIYSNVYAPRQILNKYVVI